MSSVPKKADKLNLSLSLLLNKIQDMLQNVNMSLIAFQIILHVKS